MDARIVHRFERECAELAAMLDALRGETVVYYANPGNAGDSLIAAATYQLLRHYGISYELLGGAEAARQVHGRTVMLAGGGNLVPMYSGMAAVLERLVASDNRIVVLPHSILGNESLLARLTGATTVFCREVQSWRHVQRQAPEGNVRLAHDLALYLDVDELRSSVDAEEARERFRSMLTASTNLTPESLDGRRVSCMRHGVERTSVPPGPNYDVSIVFQTGVTPGLAELGAWMMIEFARRAAAVTTNRLHVGVAAALAGTPVVLHDNSYGKVSGVYLHSIRGRFPQASFAGEMRSAAALSSV